MKADRIRAPQSLALTAAALAASIWQATAADGAGPDLSIRTETLSSEVRGAETVTTVRVFVTQGH